MNMRHVERADDESETGRIDLLVGGRLIVEIKSVASVEPIHQAQALAYLKATGNRLALVVNFNVSVLKYGIHRVIN
jgi:GxxExxY protein